MRGLIVDSFAGGGGAMRQAHRDDVARVALVATMLRQDWTPAAAVAWFDGLDEVQP